MSITLTKVLPIKLILNEKGKKIPIGGLNAKNRVDAKNVKKNFAIYMEDYPEIIVLDLDLKNHKYKKYIDTTYTHETKKGWHLFFQNSFNLTNKLSNAVEKYDVLTGKNWCFFDYQDEKVASYKEYNKLPIAPLPQEIWEEIRPKPISSQTQDFEYKIQPLASYLFKSIKKFANQRGYSGSSEIAYHISMLSIGYSKSIDFHKSLLEYFLDNSIHINQKHLNEKYLQRTINKVIDDRAHKERVNFRYLDEFRIVHSADKQLYLDIINDEFVSKAYVDNLTLDGVDIKLLNIFRIYENIIFNPSDSRRFIGNIYNSFSGFIEPIHQGDGHIVFLEFVKEVICSNNDEYYDYLINYFAHLIQKASEKPDVAIVLASPQKGIGKDTLHLLLGKLLKRVDILT